MAVVKLRNRSAWLWLGVLFCTIAEVLFGFIIGAGGEQTFAAILIGLVAGFAVGIYGARKSIGK